MMHLFIHAADYITGKLSGRYDVTDFTNVLKSGYDVRTERWPGYIWDKVTAPQGVAAGRRAFRHARRAWYSGDQGPWRNM